MDNRKKNQRDARELQNKFLQTWIANKREEFEKNRIENLPMDFTRHEPWLYPSAAEKTTLCSITKMTNRQLNTWLTNYRRRKPKYEGHQTYFQKEALLNTDALRETQNIGYSTCNSKLEEILMQSTSVTIAKNKSKKIVLHDIEISLAPRQRVTKPCSAPESNSYKMQGNSIQPSLLPFEFEFKPRPAVQPEVEITYYPPLPNGLNLQHDISSMPMICGIPVKVGTSNVSPSRTSASSQETPVLECTIERQRWEDTDDYPCVKVNSEEEFLKAYEGNRDSESVLKKDLPSVDQATLLKFLRGFEKTFPNLPYITGYLAFKKCYPDYVGNKNDLGDPSVNS